MRSRRPRSALSRPQETPAESRDRHLHSFGPSLPCEWTSRAPHARPPGPGRQEEACGVCGVRYTPARVKALLKGVRRPALGAALLLASAGPADAQTLPLRTEPAVTAPGGTLVLETGMEAIADEPSYVTGVERTRWDGPLLRLVYSPAANVELDVEWVARVGVVGEEGRGDIQSSEWGDVALRAKWRIVEGKGASPTIGARFGVILPQTSFEDVRVQPPRPRTEHPAGVRGGPAHPAGRPRAPPRQRRPLPPGRGVRRTTSGTSSPTASPSSGPRRLGLTLLAEVAGRAGDGRPGAEERSEARAGVRIGRGRVRWDAAVRRGLAEADGTWGATLGLTWTARGPATRP